MARYTAEFDFKYNHRQKLGFDDEARTIEALKGIGGKRLTTGGLVRAASHRLRKSRM
jgi:hypothetical protein